jgi:hypothetical protein
MAAFGDRMAISWRLGGYSMATGWLLDGYFWRSDGSFRSVFGSPYPIVFEQLHSQDIQVETGIRRVRTKLADARARRDDLQKRHDGGMDFRYSAKEFIILQYSAAGVKGLSG